MGQISLVSSIRAFGRGMAGEIVVRMPGLVRVSAVAGALLVAGCSSWTPSWDWVPSMGSFGGAANVSLTIESDPPGADAKTSLGASCRTPCMIPIAADREFTVTYSLNGYLPQVIAVTPRAPDMTTPDVGSGAPPPSAELSPNPVYAQLQPAPPPPASKKGRGRAPKKKQPT
jgi:hypothetical protein